MSFCLSSHPLRALVGVLALGLSACSSLDGAGSWITPYKTEVIQGNFVSKEQVEALKPGLSRAQVREVLGTPTITSAFHANRWDYSFTLRRQGVEPQKRKLVVFFSGDVLEKFEGDPMPSEAEFVTQVDTRRKPGKVPDLQATEAQLQAAQGKAPAAAPATPAPIEPAAPAAPAVYPPLEPPKR
jgi:outer membrane protein assembly factor BamE